MLHSLYDFKATYSKTLSFRTNEYFILHQTNTKHKNWWEVINEKGEMGYIPSNYVETVTVKPAFYLHYLEKCLENLRMNEINVEGSISDKNEIILRLKEIRRQIEQLPIVSRKTAGDLPPLLYKNSEGKIDTINNSPGTGSSYSSNKSEQKNNKNIETSPKNSKNIKKSLENIPSEVKSENHSESKTNIKTDSASSQNVSPPITQQSVYDLVESVRINTQLSHEMSRIAVGTVIQGLHELLPASVFPYLSTILSHSQTSMVVDDVQIDQTHDASRLKIIFNELTSCKEDAQQRSWMLHEDETVIKEYITELISILVMFIAFI